MDNNKNTWNIRPYLAMGLTAFIVIGASIILYFFIERYHGASEFMGKIMSALEPILIGIFIAYLLNPLERRIEAFIRKKAAKSTKHKTKWEKASRPIAITLSVLFFISLVAFILVLIGPKLYETIEGLVTTLPRQAQNTVAWIKTYMENNSYIAKYAEDIITETTKYVQTFLKTEILPRSKDIVTSVTSGIVVFLKALLNFFIGIIVCIYVLFEKDHFKGIFKKALYAFFPKRASNVILKTFRKSDEIFGGFFIGKIVDSMIIGVLTYIVLLIFRIPYPVLVSVIVGVTNVIPFFGPYIGSVPSTLLILLASPIKALYFLIIILIIQQLDGNIIGPKILGDKTGLSSFWVIFAILLAGGVFGFWGMLFGVPAFGVIYYIIDEVSEHFLSKKKLPPHSEQYNELDYVDEAGNVVEKKAENQ